MEIQITSRGETKASQSLQDAIYSEIESLKKYYDRITSCHVILDKERNQDIVEIVLHIAGHTVAAKAKAENVGKAIDESISKVERQLKKINEKLKNHKNSKCEK
jgi:putative sigma-54 modulation protein